MVAGAGIVITVAVLVAAGLAAYENPHVRQWFDTSRRKIAVALHSLGDEINPNARSRVSRGDDPSMREDDSEIAEERRRRARYEIMERGRILEEKRRGSKASKRASPAGSFDTLVDQDGKLKEDFDEAAPEGKTTAAETLDTSGLMHRHQRPLIGEPSYLHSPVNSSLSVQQTANSDQNNFPTTEPDLMTQYETEMRDAWHLPLPTNPNSQAPSSHHPSESLIELTPTSEFPDPDFSIPLRQEPLERSSYFSAASGSSRTLSSYHQSSPPPPPYNQSEPEYYYAHPHHATMSMNPAPISPPLQDPSVSSAPSLSGSIDHVFAQEAESSDDGIMSENGDGMVTPASWTEVGSVVSSEGDR